MFSFTSINLLILFYLLFLIISALFVEKIVKKKKNRSLLANPYIYSLSMAVYCTSWTYYGSVGVAANSGMLYITIYLGAFLSVILYPWILDRLILVKEKYRITSMTDFVSARYDKSERLGMLASVFILIGIIPYIAIQIKSILDTVHIISSGVSSDEILQSSWTSHYIVILCILVTIFFGLRKLDSTEKHPGLVFILACESIIKLIAVMAVGYFCTYGINHGFDSILEKIPQVVDDRYHFMGQTTIYDFFTWCTYLILSASAIMFLPRQFQVSVIENYDRKHIKKASWLFPLFLFLINIYVIPVAITGLSLGLPIEKADSFVLLLPMKYSQSLLTLFVFLGGFSAAVGMIMIETVAVSTIVSNQLFLPILNKVKRLSSLTKHTLKIRWASAFFIIYASYFYTTFVGSKYALVSMGLISFVAIMQFAPLIIAGLFWKKANKHGAMIGLASGSLVWFYTLIIPAFAKSGWISPDIMFLGPWGISWLRPEALLGMGNFHFLTHALIWTMFFNLTGLFLGSMLFDQNESEAKIIQDFEYSFLNPDTRIDIQPDFENLAESINLSAKIILLRRALEKYLTFEEAQAATMNIMTELQLENKSHINIYTLSKLSDKAEQYLAGLVGSSVAFYTMEGAGIYTAEERKELGELYGSLLAMMKVDPRELSQKLAELQNRQGQLEQDARSLEQAMQKKQNELENQKELAYQASKMASLGEVAAGIAHEINNPLAIISSSAQIMETLLAKENIDRDKFKTLTTNIKQTVARASRIVQGMRNISRQSENDRFETVCIADMLEDSTSLCAERFKANGVSLKIFADDEILKSNIEVNRTTISQALINFLNNAYDAVISNKEKWVEIHLSITGEKLFIKLIDSGLGISQEIQDKIFQPFFTTKDVGKGTGLGLSLSVSFIKQHNGSVVIDNKNPHTCFIICLPLKHGPK